MRKIIFISSLLIFGIVQNNYCQNTLKIVSLSPSITHTINLLEADNLLVGHTSYCTILNPAGKTVIASAIDVNIEKVISLRPNIVFATSLTKPITIETFKKLGIKTAVYSTPKSYEALCGQFLEIGTTLGKKSLAEEIIEKQRERLLVLGKKVPVGNNRKIFFQIGANPLFTVIPNTFMDDYISLLGGKNIAADLKSGSMTRESVLIRNPDIIIIISMGGLGEDEKKVWEKYRSIKAVQNNKIFVVDADRACSPTPVTFVDVLEELVGLIY